VLVTLSLQNLSELIWTICSSIGVLRGGGAAYSTVLNCVCCVYNALSLCVPLYVLSCDRRYCLVFCSVLTVIVMKTSSLFQTRALAIVIMLPCVSGTLLPLQLKQLSCKFYRFSTFLYSSFTNIFNPKIIENLLHLNEFSHFEVQDSWWISDH